LVCNRHMPTFFYKAKISPREISEGKIEAENRSQAVNKLLNQGYFPISVQDEPGQYGEGFLVLKKISGHDFYVFSHQLAVLINSGLDLLSSLNTITTQTHNRHFKRLTAELAAKVKDGDSLSKAMAGYPQIFSPFYTAMVRSAETGGNLEETLNRLADYCAKDQELRANIKQALVYPIFVASVGFFTIFVLLGFVVPRLSSVFTDLGHNLPLPTKIILGLGKLFQNYWFIILAGCFLGFFFLRAQVKKEKVKKALDSFKLKAPVIGEIAVKIELTHFCRGLFTLLKAGVPIGTALETAQGIVDNGLIKDEIKKIREEVSRGIGFAASLKTCRYFPAFMINVASVGEESGKLDESLLKISQEYEADTDRNIKMFTKLLEPVLILIMGLIVGFIVIAMLLPLFQMDLMAK